MKCSGYPKLQKHHLCAATSSITTQRLSNRIRAGKESYQHLTPTLAYCWSHSLPDATELIGKARLENSSPAGTGKIMEANRACITFALQSFEGELEAVKEKRKRPFA